MSAAIALREDYDAGLVRELAKRSDDADQVRRLLALAAVYDGGLRSDGAEAGGVGLQTFCDWVLRFNADGPAGLVNGKAPGQAPRLDQAQQGELAQLIEAGPIPAVYGVVRWRLCDLAQWVMETYRTSISEQTLSRYLRAMGYRKLSARPRHHAQNAAAVTAFKKRMARPVCKGKIGWRVGLHQRIRSRGLSPGQDGFRALRASQRSRCRTPHF